MQSDWQGYAYHGNFCKEEQRTREAKIQVELAQLKYRSQRLIGFGISMSRLGGGVGKQGSRWKKKLEIDRRRIEKKTAHF